MSMLPHNRNATAPATHTDQCYVYCSSSCNRVKSLRNNAIAAAASGRTVMPLQPYTQEDKQHMHTITMLQPGPPLATSRTPAHPVLGGGYTRRNSTGNTCRTNICAQELLHDTQHSVFLQLPQLQCKWLSKCCAHVITKHRTTVPLTWHCELQRQTDKAQRATQLCQQARRTHSIPQHVPEATASAAACVPLAPP